MTPAEFCITKYWIVIFWYFSLIPVKLILAIKFWYNISWYRFCNLKNQYDIFQFRYCLCFPSCSCLMETCLQRSCMPRGTLSSKHRENPDHLQVQSHLGQGEDFWGGWKQLGSLINRKNQHKAGVSSQRHNQTMTDQVRGCNLDWTRMLHLDHGSCDLSGQIGNNWNSDENQGLSWRVDGAFQLSQHWCHSLNNPGTEDQVQWHFWNQWTVQPIVPDETDWGPLDLHLASSHDPE